MDNATRRSITRHPAHKYTTADVIYLTCFTVIIVPYFL